MEYDESTPFYRALSTRYDPSREEEAICIVLACEEIARLEWPGPDQDGKPFVHGATLLHYAANDGRLDLMKVLVERGADVNAANARWYRSVLSWAANNARIEAMDWLLQQGADPGSADALHAAAWGGSSAGADHTKDYAGAIELLVSAGADLQEQGPRYKQRALELALESGNLRAADAIRRLSGRA